MNNINKKWLYLPLETKTRDLPGRILFACIAAKKGFNSVIFHKSDISKKIKFFPRGIFIYFGIVANYYSEMSRVKSYGHKITAWDEEGITIINEKEYLLHKVSPECFSLLETFFAWGEAHKNAVSSKTGNDKIVLTGHPRFDLLRPEFRCLLKKGADAIKNKFGPAILVNSRFGTYNHYNGHDFGLRVLKSKGFFCNKEEQSFWTGKYEYDGQIFSSLLELIPLLSESFPEHTIIIRPHPSENLLTWKKVADKFRNVKVIHEGNVLEWISASDIVLHNGCTTAIEAYVLQKPCISYRPVISEKYDMVLPNSLSIEIYNKENLINIMSQILKNPDFKESDDETIRKKILAEKNIFSLTGSSASEKIISSLSELAVPLCSPNLNLYNLLCLNYRDTVKLIKRSIYKLIKGSPSYLEHKFPGISLNELNQAIETLKTVSDDFLNVKTKKISSGCFQIFSD